VILIFSEPDVKDVVKESSPFSVLNLVLGERQNRSPLICCIVMPAEWLSDKGSEKLK
jgi:hypothetical protein